MKPYFPNFGLGETTSFIGELIESLTVRGRGLLGRRDTGDRVGQDLVTLGEMLLSRRGEASGVALATSLLARYRNASAPERLSFLRSLANDFGPDEQRLSLALQDYQSDPDTVARLHAATEPRRQELFRRLNLAPGGTAALVGMRSDLLDYLPENGDLKAVNHDFFHLFTSWFNRGFLVLRPIDWSTPANILEKIIRYEAVHAIDDWDDLRNRLAPPDRRCFAFFHPQLIDEPLIFVEVALTTEMPDAIGPLLETDRVPIKARDATTAVFYSISNTQTGLAGVSFGSFLIKQVAEDLKRELPNLEHFVTLSPVPNFAAWLSREARANELVALTDDQRSAIALLSDPGWHTDETKVEAVRPLILQMAAAYFLDAKTADGKPRDQVARFHLGNGARLERLNFLGDCSPKGLRQSHGLMVNYRYDLQEIERNHEAFAEKGEIVTSAAIRKERSALASAQSS